MEIDDNGSAATTTSSCNDYCSDHSSSDDSVYRTIYESAEFYFAKKQLEYNTEIQPNTKPRDVDDVWQEIVNHFSEPFIEIPKPSDRLPSVAESLSNDNNNEVPNNVVADVITCPEALKEVLKSHDHVNETAFTEMLFDTLRYCLNDQHMIDPKSTTNNCMDDELIVFTHAKHSNYAIGIVQEIDGKQKLGTNNKESPTDTRESNDNQSHETDQHALPVDWPCTRTQLDHCACLLKKDSATGEWQVVEYLSAVKLNVAGTHVSCQVFEDDMTNYDARKALRGQFCTTRRSLAQVMLYTMAWVLPSHAKIGQLSTEIPWCVIVGNKKRGDRTMMDRWCRWVSGNIYVPKKCGDTFTFAVTGFGKMQQAGNENDETVNDALSVYLDTILFGLRVAKTWLIALANHQDCASVATSGQNVIIGETTLTDLVLRGRAGGLGKADPNHCNGREWKVNQGEIFTGRFNIRQLEEASNVNGSYFIFFNNVDEEVDVVVKVHSVAIHKSLVKKEDARCAFVVLHDAEKTAKLKGEIANRSAKYAKLMRGHDIVQTSRKPHQVSELLMSPALYDVLLAVDKTPTGLITIMVDLSLQGYTALRPIKCIKDDLPVLWKAFLALLECVLIPLAHRCIIHPDLRPGYDETANILYKMEGEGKDKRPDMKLIDYESMLCHIMWSCPRKAHSLYIKHEWAQNARTFLWWQCVAIAYAWKHGMSQREMAKVDLKEEVNQRPDWLKCFFGNDDKRKMTMDLLPHLDDLFTY